MPKIVIFDFDGTLADTSDLSYKVYCEMAKRHRMEPLTSDEIELMNKLSIRERLKKHGVSIFKLPRFVKESLAIYHSLSESAPCFPGVDQLIEALYNDGYILAIVSSNSVENITRFLNSHNLNYFDYIYGKASLFGKGKKVVKLLKKAKIHRKDAIYIGDEYRDIVAAKKKKIPIIAVTWGYDHLDLIKKANPDYLVNSLEELQQLIQTLSKKASQ